jgi:hypothetical protein
MQKDGRITKEESGHPTNHKVPNRLKPEDPGVSYDDSYYFGSGTKEIGIRVTHTFKSITSFHSPLTGTHDFLRQRSWPTNIPSTTFLTPIHQPIYTISE